MPDPLTIAATGAGGTLVGGWLTKMLVQRTLKQYDKGLADIHALEIEMAAQKVIATEIIKPLRVEVQELRERLAKAEAALAKGWDADKALEARINSVIRSIQIKNKAEEAK